MNKLGKSLMDEIERTYWAELPVAAFMPGDKEPYKFVNLVGQQVAVWIRRTIKRRIPK